MPCSLPTCSLLAACESYGYVAAEARIIFSNIHGMLRVVWNSEGSQCQIFLTTVVGRLASRTTWAFLVPLLDNIRASACHERATAVCAAALLPATRSCFFGIYAAYVQMCRKREGAGAQSSRQSRCKVSRITTNVRCAHPHPLP